MEITRQNINELHRLTAENRKAEDVASELLRTAQDRYNHVEHEIERLDPKTQKVKKIKLTEKIMWQEVFYAGTNVDSAKILKEKHPEVFDAYKEQEKTAGALQHFCSVELDIDIKKMRISDYVALTEALIALRMDEKENGIVSPIQPGDEEAGNTA